MNEEMGVISGVGATSPMDDFVSSHDEQVVPKPGTLGVADGSSRPTAQDVQSSINEINSYLSGINRVLSLEVDPSSGYTVVQISDAQTGEVLQQMPTEDRIQLELMLARWSHSSNVLMDVEA